jgi:hypothetical protein
MRHLFWAAVALVLIAVGQSYGQEAAPDFSSFGARLDSLEKRVTRLESGVTTLAAGACCSPQQAQVYYPQQAQVYYPQQAQVYSAQGQFMGAGDGGGACANGSCGGNGAGGGRRFLFRPWRRVTAY